MLMWVRAVLPRLEGVLNCWTEPGCKPQADKSTEPLVPYRNTPVLVDGNIWNCGHTLNSKFLSVSYLVLCNVCVHDSSRSVCVKSGWKISFLCRPKQCCNAMKRGGKDGPLRKEKKTYHIKDHLVILWSTNKVNIPSIFIFRTEKQYWIKNTNS